MNDKIKEIKTALAKATPGPWEVLESPTLPNDYLKKVKNFYGSIGTHILTEDAEFIAKSPEYITYLLQLVETQSKALNWYASLWNHDVELEDIGLTSMQIDRG